MAKYEVTLPFAGFAYVQVKAESEEAAIQTALETAEATIVGSGKTDISDWEFLRYTVRGNVNYTPRREAEAKLIDED